MPVNRKLYNTPAENSKTLAQQALTATDTGRIPTTSTDSYSFYNQQSAYLDNEFINNCSQSMDSLLVFAGLFSATITALIVETYKLLDPEPRDRGDMLLEAIFLRLSNENAQISITKTAVSPKVWCIVINALFFTSLFSALMAALGALLVKQWVRQLDMGLSNIVSSRKRARARHTRMEAMGRYGLPGIVSGIPMILHFALLLFVIGLLIWLYELHVVLFCTILVFASASFALYLTAAVYPIFDPTVPFNWPVSHLLKNLWDASYLYFRRRSTNSVESGLDTIGLVHTHPRAPFPTIYTPIYKYNSIEHDIIEADHVDMAIFCDFLLHAETVQEISMALTQIPQIFKNGKPLLVITKDQLQILFRANNTLAGSCQLSGEAFSITPHSRKDACTSLGFLEWILQIPKLELAPSRELLVRGRRLSASLIEYGLKNKGVVETVLGHCALARIDHFASNEPSPSPCIHVMTALEVTISLQTWGPGPPGSASQKLPAWPISDHQYYQECITPYILSLINCVIYHCPKGDHSGEQPYKDLQSKIHGIIAAAFILRNSQYVQDENYVTLRKAMLEILPTLAQNRWAKDWIGYILSMISD